MNELTSASIETASAEKASACWRDGVQRRRVEQLIELLHPDVVLHSPLTSRVRFEGRQRVGELLRVVSEVFDGVSYHTDVGDAGTRVLVGTGHVGGREFEETQLLRLDEDGLITEITLFIRPLPALAAVLSVIGPRIARQRGKRRLATVLGPLSKPLELLTAFGDRRVVPLVLHDGR